MCYIGTIYDVLFLPYLYIVLGLYVGALLGPYMGIGSENIHEHYVGPIYKHCVGPLYGHYLVINYGCPMR